MARQQTRTQTRPTRLRAVENAGAAVEMMEGAMERMEQTGEQMRDGARQSMTTRSPFAVLGAHAFETWMRGSNEAMRRVLELNVELASWGREQLDDSMHAVRSLSQCRSFGAAYSVQLGLVQSSMENSLRHANKVMSLTAHAMAAGAAQQPSESRD